MINQSRSISEHLIKILGIGLTGFGLLVSVWQGLEDRRLTQERLVTERFSKAVKQLGKHKEIQGQIPDTTVRIGAIYALEQIAKDSNKDHWKIMEVLTAYVRENSSLPSKLKQLPKNEQEREQRWKELAKLSEVNIDVQAVLTVIRRREDPKLNRDEKIDLTFTNLQEADLRGANLQKAFLQGVNLQEADLWGANLQEAFLLGANLQKVFLWGANLQKAFLHRANLQEADLNVANLQKAFLLGANLQEADLRGANLQEADLWGANLQEAVLWEAKNLTHQQIKSACFWEKAIYKVELNDRKIIIGVKEPDNTNYIEYLKKDQLSESEKTVDCSKWE